MVVARVADASGGWQLAHGAPGPALGGAVRRYCGYVERTGAPLRRSELPHASVTVILSFGPRMRVDGARHDSFVAALYDRPALTEHDGDQHGLELKLSPPGARRLLGVPLGELHNATVPLDAVLDAGTLLEELAEAPDWETRFARVDAELTRRLAGAPAPHPAVRAAWRALVASRGTVPVGTLARELGWSRRHLAARFREDVGAAPKFLARLLRFEHAAERIHAGGTTLGEVALACGYYDQAHLNREFRALAGESPGALLARALPDGRGWSGDERAAA